MAVSWYICRGKLGGGGDWRAVTAAETRATHLDHEGATRIVLGLRQRLAIKFSLLGMMVGLGWGRAGWE